MKDIAQEDFLTLVSAILLVFSLAALYYLVNSRKALSILMVRISKNALSSEVADFVTDKLSGFLLFGPVLYIISLNVKGFAKVIPGFSPGKFNEYWYFYTLLPIIACIFSFFFSKNPKNRNSSPALRTREWHSQHIFISASGWTIYLLGYEFMLRGILWFLCMNIIGFWPSLLINVAVYALIHIPKGIVMTTGSIPVGVIFCFITHLTGSFLPAFIIHSAMSVSNDIFSARNNPDFSMVFRKKQA